MYTHRPRGVCTNGEVTLGGKRSGVWNVSSGPQEQRLPVKQVPGGLEVGEDLYPRPYFFLIIYFCFAGSSWLCMGFL